MDIIVPEIALDVINREIPHKVRARIATVINYGYELVKQHVEKEAFLGGVWKEQTMGMLRPYGIWFMFQQEIEKRALPFNYSIKFTKRNTYRYLALYTKNAEITISQVQHPDSIARKAYFRKIAQEVNQLKLDLFGNNLVLDEPYRLLLTHGYGGDRPYFINIGLPCEKGWIEKIDILKEPFLVDGGSSEAAEEIKITEDLEIGFKEFLSEDLEIGFK